VRAVRIVRESLVARAAWGAHPRPAGAGPEGPPAYRSVFSPIGTAGV